MPQNSLGTQRIRCRREGRLRKAPLPRVEERGPASSAPRHPLAEPCHPRTTPSARQIWTTVANYCAQNRPEPRPEVDGRARPQELPGTKRRFWVLKGLSRKGVRSILLLLTSVACCGSVNRKFDLTCADFRSSRLPRAWPRGPARVRQGSGLPWLSVRASFCWCRATSPTWQMNAVARALVSPMGAAPTAFPAHCACAGAWALDARVRRLEEADGLVATRQIRGQSLTA